MLDLLNEYVLAILYVLIIANLIVLYYKRIRPKHKKRIRKTYRRLMFDYRKGRLIDRLILQNYALPMRSERHTNNVRRMCRVIRMK